ncbi:MAG: hypothetical protein B6D59_05110 [Campylobacteraceae bacterium 4484_4]|nr:MAG: hypothetical protein B6D59_05110 [Campylobacteraceae bacterium 4484_4]
MRRVVLSTLLASLIVSGSLFAKEEVKSQNMTQTNITMIKKSAVTHAKETAQSNRKKLVQEAIDSLKFAHQALVDLEKGEKEKATENIEKALGKLEVILAAEKAPKLLPVDGAIVIHEYAGSSKEAKAAVKLVKDFLDQGRVQQARRLLNTLQSEMDITVINLPLVSYPDALKLAAKYIHDDKADKAKEVLAIALSTFDEVTQVIPLPLLKAIDLSAAASKIAKEDKKRALAYLDAAEEQIELAEVLGYVSESTTTYRNLHKMIKGLKKEIRGKNRAEKLFEEFLTKLKEFKNKAFYSSHEEKK